MKKLSIMISLVFVLSLLVPAVSAFAYDTPNQKGNAISGQMYTGTLAKNSGGNSIPDEYTLVIEKNSMVRFQAYTQANDYFLDLDCPNNPYAAPETYTTVRGSACTKVYDFYKNEPETYGTSGIGVTADKRNTNPYTEVFTNLVAGTYKVRISGGPDYSFKVLVDPLMFGDDSPTLVNYQKDSALDIMLNQAKEGNLITNGVVNGKYYSENYDKVVRDYFKLNITSAGKYKVALTTDGFFQGSVEVYTPNGNYAQNGSIDASLSFDGGATKDVAATFEKHKAAAGTVFTTEFTAEKTGTYYFQVNQKSFTAGSYSILVSANGGAIIPTPTVIPTPTPDTTTTPYVTPYVTPYPYVTPTPPVTDVTEAILDAIKVMPAESKISIGATVELKAQAIYTNNDTEDVTDFAEWTSSDSNIATVNESGVVKGVGAGTATIKAVLEDKIATVKVRVTGSDLLIKKLVPLKAKIYLKIGKTASNKITAFLYNGTKKIVTSNVTLSSSNKCVIIYKNTTLKAISKGTAKITVTYGNSTTTYTVVVK